MMNTLKDILAILKDEFFLVIKDPATVLIMVIGAFMYSLFYSVPYSGELVRDIPVAVVDNDNTSLSRKFIQYASSNEYIQIVLRPATLEEAKKEFYLDKIKAYVVIPRDFEKNIYENKPATLSLYSDSSYLIVYKQITNGVLTTAASLSAGLEIKKIMLGGMHRDQAEAAVVPFNYIQVPLYNPSGGYRTYILPLVLVLILQQTMLIGVGLLGGSRREITGSCAQSGEKYCGNTGSPLKVVLGRSCAYVLLYSLHSLFFFIIIPHLFSLGQTANYLALYAIIIPFLFSVSFLAQTLVYFFKKREASILMLVSMSLPLVFLPGFIWPKESIPQWLNVVGNFIPSNNAIDAIVRMNQMGAAFAQIKSDFIILIFLCAIYLTSAYFVAKHISNSEE